MKMIVEFDLDVDIIDVPQCVIDSKDRLRSRFLKWLYDESFHHKYWVDTKDASGRKIRGLRYRSDAFVEWLNKKVLSKTGEAAVVLDTHVAEHPENLPKIFF